jgi:DtxR family transcriptional regulator, Mn-dependent transcriptional regulator
MSQTPPSVHGPVVRIGHVAPGYHPPLEEYLETIHDLAEAGTPVIQARIAERLGRAAPSVSEMLDRLQADGYVERDGRRLELTGKGRTVAEGVVRKHRLAERLLVDIIGLEWHKAHLEAGRWEHVISDEVEARLIELLGNPTTCPHGNPIPGAGQTESEVSGHSPLSSASVGDVVRLERITEEVELDTKSLQYLFENSFIPGNVAKVVDQASDSTLLLDSGQGGTPFALGPGLCSQLYVSLVAAA